jgi:hypothetical protein
MPRRDEYDYEDDDYDRRDDHYDDDRRDEYDDRPRRRSSREYANERVTLPAIFLMIVGALGFFLAIANAAYVLSGAGDDQPNPFGNNNRNMKNDPSYIAGEVVALVVTIGWGLLVFLGGLLMKGLKSRGFVLFASILAMLPCNWCCVLGIPFGVWALVVVLDERVKRGFA